MQIGMFCIQDSRTLVHIAAQNGHAGVVSMLLNKHFNAASCDKVAFQRLIKLKFELHS